ncbi:hypothetical protein QBC39DRAFT_356335 [Podospora conica]|nr:hypothetical protein QBC39DRAFT_356335 [Schizothecium conicum]
MAATTSTRSLVLGVPTATFLAATGVFESNQYRCPEAQQNQDGIPFNASIHGVPANLPSPAITLLPNPTGVVAGTTVDFTCFYTVAVATSIPGNQTTIPGNQTTIPGNETTTECSNTLPAGAVAGIAIGTGLACAVLGVAAVMMLGLRRGSRHRSSDKSPVLHVPIVGGPGGGSKSKSGSASGPSPPPMLPKGEVETLAGLHYYLLDGPGDSELVEELTSLGHLLKDHVQISYHSAPLGQDCLEKIRSSLSDLGFDREKQSHIANLALNERTRQIAIRAVLARVIFSALDPRSSNPSLLPPSVVAFVKTVPLNRDGKLTSQDIAALSTWRRVSAYLLHEHRIDRSPLQIHADIDAQIGELRAALDGFLGIFVHKGDRARVSQSNGLERAIRACAKFGYKLFSHPCEWQLSFGTEAESSNVVVLPGLVRWSAPDGEVYKSERVILQPAIVDV